MRVYLDNCCFNRPYDEQTLLKIKLETQAKLSIQKMILDNQLELVWSFILEFENDQNPFFEKSVQIGTWQDIAVIDYDFTDEVSEKSKRLMNSGLRTKDSLHVACAILAKADYFITVDKGILNKRIGEIKVVNPVDFIFLKEETI